MMRIRFKDEDYLFTGDSLEEDGAITTDELYKNGECSYAHLFEDGSILRFLSQIGVRADITILETNVDVEPDNFGLAIMNILTSPSWDGP